MTRGDEGFKGGGVVDSSMRRRDQGGGGCGGSLEGFERSRARRGAKGRRRTLGRRQPASRPRPANEPICKCFVFLFPPIFYLFLFFYFAVMRFRTFSVLEGTFVHL